MKFDWSRVQPELMHFVILVGTAFGGAVLGYFQSQPTVSIFEALQSWTTAKPLVFGALFAGVTAVIALAKQSFISPPAPPPAATLGGSKPPKKETVILPPNAARMALAGALMVAGIACTASTWQTIQAATNASGVACEALFVAVNPAVAPLCTTAAQIAQAIEAFVATFATVDGGTGAMSAAAQNAWVHDWLVQHGATPVKK